LDLGLQITDYTFSSPLPPFSPVAFQVTDPSHLPPPKMTLAMTLSTAEVTMLENPEMVTDPSGDVSLCWCACVAFRHRSSATTCRDVTATTL
jgi:hypothetical protein